MASLESGGVPSCRIADDGLWGTPPRFARPGFPSQALLLPAAGRARAQAADGAFTGARGPWPAKRVARSSAMVAAPGMFILLAVLTDW